MLNAFRALHSILARGSEETLRKFEALDRINHRLDKSETSYDAFVLLCEQYFPGLLVSNGIDGYTELIKGDSGEGLLCINFNEFICNFSLRGIMVRAAQLLRACIIMHEKHIDYSSDTHGRLGILLAKTELELITLLTASMATVDWGQLILERHCNIKFEAALAALPEADRSNSKAVAKSMKEQFSPYCDSISDFFQKATQKKYSGLSSGGTRPRACSI